ncbi:hypothetical protein CALVIDRAFT_561093 [Calocera viscosa TUFC12733]|uniref:G-patch domain-containing protein n=1 Tax=Calocera viscosa (strain TUFC12733) TaxID=1330018 RepID=A0A167QHK7_CALVF|nr:hypothetical protein CALVIDRAFT_561093 [Calocera viscosa TUFC12733]
MSEATVARWRAIPLEHPAGSGSGERDKPSLKRPASEANDSEDDVSLISRSPSPPQREKRGGTHSTYEEDERGYGYEKPSLLTPIAPTNVGHALLLKMGWRTGEGLGPAGDGRKEPVPFVMKSDSLGLGKLTQELRIAQTTVERRREMESERLLRETAAEREVRESKVRREQAVQQEVKQQIRQFYCELCGKQYQTVAQFDEHERSYSHLHKQRMKEVQEQQRKAGSADVDSRREKERKREERELKKMAAAAGIKLPSSVPKPAVPSGSPVPPTDTAEEQPAKKGWKTFAATVTAPALGPPPSNAASGGFKKSGWAAVGPAAVSAAAGPSGGFTPSGPAPLATPASNSARTFQSAGYTTLDTSSPAQAGPERAPSQPGWNSERAPAQPAWSSQRPPARSRWAPVRADPSMSARPPEPPGLPPPPPEQAPPAPLAPPWAAFPGRARPPSPPGPPPPPPPGRAPQAPLPPPSRSRSDTSPGSRSGGRWATLPR